MKHEKNFAFIDAQNLNLGVRELGWKLSHKRFRAYLRHKYHVTKAYLFIGYIPSNANLYRALQEDGYVLIFKPVLALKGRAVKGNVDAELVLHAMIQLPNYDKAVIVTSDGDFACLVEYLSQQGKLKVVLSPSLQKCSILLRQKAKERIDFLENVRGKLEYKNKKEGTA